MDAETIKSQRIVERYLSGDLPTAEVRAFESFCQEHPEVVDQLAIPVRLKTRLAAKPFEGTHTSVFSAIPSTIERIDTTTVPPIRKRAAADADDAEHAARFSTTSNSRWVLMLLAAALLGVVFLAWQNHGQQTQMKAFAAKAKVLKLRAPGSSETLRIVPSNTRPVSPQLTISLAEPKLLEVHLDVSDIQFNSYALTIDKIDEARVFVIRRMVADTNKELRFDLNSSALGAGDYELKLEGYDYRGATTEAGWVMWHME